MKIQASKKFTINKPITNVYNFLADGENNMKWRPGVISIQKIKGNLNTVGAVYKQSVKGPMNKEIEADYEIEELIQNVKIVFHVIKGPVRPTGIFEFKELSESKTELTFTLLWEPKGLKVLLAPMVKQTMEQEVETANNIDACIILQ